MESRWTWRFLALPGVAWLSIFFLVSFYAVICVAFGNQNTLNEPVPIWNPLDWNVGYVDEVLQNIRDGGQYLTLFVRTFVFVRHRRWRSLCSSATRSPTTPRAMPGGGAGVILLLLVLPWWINYLMRMLAWINLLSPEGWATRVLALGVDRPALHLARPARERGRLARGPDGHGDPRAGLRLRSRSSILPLYAALDRIDQRHIEAARDLGASPFQAFRRVTLPLSMPGILAGLVLIALPMFGDYYTPDLVSASPETSLIGNQIDQFTRQGSQKVVGAVLTILLAVACSSSSCSTTSARRDARARGRGT